ncbi:hypothetical protein [Nocardia brasiliensis]|uniref:hypothetical protein n=1 Tax=Nocardia brasiliensis TaxID=37326 RepID=UPI002458EE8D|nr:hypothetical protein [Nocardia brasiliensis]
MSKQEKLVEGPMESIHVEFSGRSLAEMFRAAADWCAANDGELDLILGVGIRVLDGKQIGEPDTWYAMSICYDK